MIQTSRNGLVPDLRVALSARDPFEALVHQVCPGVYSLKAFSDAFCSRLLDEVEQHDSAPPNTMNKYGVVLKNIGLGPLCQDLLTTVVNPLVQRFYPGTKVLKRYHGFIVNYDPKKQSSLDLHHDDSVMTLNVCLGRSFTGGDLIFRDDDEKRVACVKHKVGKAILHPGSFLHQAQGIKTGKRSNLILWCR